MNNGIYLIAAIVIVFYLRMYLVRRGKRRREKLAVLDHIKQGKHAKALPVRDMNAPAITVRSWWLLVPGFVLMLLGLAMNYEGLLPAYNSYWWIPMAVGGILLIFSFE
jgi:hypothetical protein